MGHERRYRSFDGKATPKRITDVAMDDIAHSGDRYGSQSVRFLADICDSYDEAYDLIERKAQNQFYPAYAVQYKQRSHAKTEAVKKAEEKINKLAQERAWYMKAHSVHERKSEFIGCPSCGSKLANKRFGGEYCPVCRADLRPQTTQEKIKWYDAKINTADKAVREAYNKNAVTGVEWLVMYEVHI